MKCKSNMFALTLCLLLAFSLSAETHAINTTSPFYLSFNTGESFQIQIQDSPRLFITFTVQSGTLVGVGSLNTSGTTGIFLITPSTSGTLAVSYPSTVNLYINGIRYTAPYAYTSGNSFTVTWDYNVYSLTITSAPTQVPFTVNGSATCTPYSRQLVAGAYQIVFPYNFTRSGSTWTFKQWNDTGDANPVRTINLQSNMALSATYTVEVQPTELQPTFAYEMSGYVAEAERVILMDSSVYKNYGTTANTSTAPTMKLGAVGMGLYFDGVDDYIQIPNRNESNQLSAFFVLAMWIKPSQRGVTQWILSKANEYEVLVESSNKLTFRVYDSVLGWVAATSTTTLTLETWYHVIAVYNTTHVSIRINGVEENSTATSGGFNPTTNPLYLGVNFKGMIDELLCFKRLLSESEMRMLYSAPFKIEPPSTYTFTSGSGNYGFYGNYFETPWANGTSVNSWVQTEHYLYGFAKFRSKITLKMNQSQGSYAIWTFVFYKRGIPQSSVTLYLQKWNETALTVYFGQNNQWLSSGVFVFNTSTTTFYLQVDGWNDPSGQFGLRVVVFNDKQQALAGSKLVPDDDKGYREYFFDYLDLNGAARSREWFDPIVKTIIKVGVPVGYGFVGILEHESFPFLLLVAILIVSAISIGTVYYLASVGNPIAKAIVETVFQPIIDFLSNLAGQIAQALKPVGDWIVSSLVGAAQPLLSALASAANWLMQQLIAGLDAVFSLFGWQNGFSQILAYISSIFGVVSTAFTAFVAVMGIVVNVFIGVFTQIFNVFANAINTVATIVQALGWIWSQVSPAFGWVADVFWKLLPLLFVFYCLWVIAPLIDEGDWHKSLQRIEDTVGLMWRIVNGMRTIASLVLDTIYKLVEMIPVVE